MNTINGDQVNANDLQEKQMQPPTTTTQPESSSSGDLILYEGYTFFQADSVPGQQASWSRVERTHMHLSQSEFYKMVQKRAGKISAAQQYQMMADIRRAHVDQLIHEQRRINPQIEWSCAYAKERDRPSKPRNAHPRDYETVSMDIVLLKRPMDAKLYPRTPMGDLVDLASAHRQNTIQQKAIEQRALDIKAEQRPINMAPARHPPVSSSFISNQTVTPGCVVQGPLPRPVSVTSPFTHLDLGQQCVPENGKRMKHERRASANRDPVQVEPHIEDWGLESSGSDDDESTIFDQKSADEGSSTDEPEDMDCECQALPMPRARRPQSCSPHRRESNFGSQYRRKSKGPAVERRDRYHARKNWTYDPIPSTKNTLPAKRARSVVTGPSDPVNRERKYRAQRLDEDEMRNRLLECEARIEQWERAFEHQRRILQSIEDSQQLEPCRSYYDLSCMRH